MTRVSIITVTLNNLHGLRKTVESVAEQNYSAMEHIVIDGASTDGSREYLQSVAAERLTWVSEKDQGIYDAMNKGIKMASGEYLLFLNAGDVLDSPAVLSEVAPFLEGGEDIVYGNLKFDDAGVIRKGYMPERISVDHMMRDTLWHPASFVRHDLFTRHGYYDTGFRLCGDYEFFFRTLLVKNARSRHIGIFIARFDLTGLTSDVKNHSLVQIEKKRVHEMYPAVTAQWNSVIRRIKRWFR